LLKNPECKTYIQYSEKFQGTLFFRASASCSKILNVKRIFNTVKNFRAHSVFQDKRKLLKNPECKTYIQYSKKFQGTLFFGAIASCSKILNVKRIFNTVKNFRAHSVFQDKRKLLKNPECKTYIQYSEKFQGTLFFGASANCSKIVNVKRIFNTVKNFRHTLFFGASASCSKILNVKRIFNTVKNSRATLLSGQAQVAQKS